MNITINHFTDEYPADLIIYFSDIEIDNYIFDSILKKVTERLDEYFLNKKIEFSTIELKSNKYGHEDTMDKKDITFVIELYLQDENIQLKDIPDMPSDNEIIKTVREWINELI